MAPQNLNQVFIANNVDMLATTTFSNNAAVTASNVNVWDVDAGTNFSAAALTTKKRIQITQTMPSGNCIASPIIEVKDIKRINFEPWSVVGPKVRVQSYAAAAPSASKNVMIRIALRTAPTDYNSFAAPSSSYNDLSGEGFTFPLVGNFAAGRMIFNIEVAAATHAGGANALATAIFTAVNANPTLKAIFKVDNTTAGTVIFAARHFGVDFDLIAQYSDGAGAIGAVTPSYTIASTAFSPATVNATNYVQALSDEKKQRARYGNFNRMYFPFAFPEFAQPGYKYDVIEIQYAHSWPSSTGIARAGELNTVRIYAGASSTALTYAAAATGSELATVF